MEALSRTNAKRITVHGQAALDGLEGVRGRKEAEETVSFLYSGDIKRLLQTLAAGDIQDLSVTEPDLEEIFLHYYEDGGEQA